MANQNNDNSSNPSAKHVVNINIQHLVWVILYKVCLATRFSWYEPPPCFHLWIRAFSFRLQQNKKQKFSAHDIVESWSEERWSISYVTSVDITAQVSLIPWSIFLFSDLLTLKLKIMIIILPTDWPEIILLMARTTKN